MNPPGLAGALTKSRGLADTKTTTEALKNMAQQLQASRKVGVEPDLRKGSLAGISGSDVTLTPNLPIEEKVVTNITDEATGYRPPRPGEPFTGMVKGKQGTGTKRTGAPVGPQLTAERAYASGNIQRLSYGMQRSAKHLGMELEEFNAFLAKGIKDGTITFFTDPSEGTSGVVINGQPHAWLYV